jgi:hypothetical protein
MINSVFNRVTFSAAMLSLAVTFLATAAIAAATAQTLGTITQVDGTAFLQRGGAATPVTTNTPVMLNDTITTGPDSLVGIYMSDGSTLSIVASSSAEIVDSTMVGGQAVISRVKLIKGRVHANVPDKPGTPTRRLQIDSANANVVGPAPSYVP